jgi:hypothetical protein
MRLLYLIDRKGFLPLMRMLYLIDQKESLWANKVVIPHLPEGNPSSQRDFCFLLTRRKSIQSWDQRLPHPLKHEGWFGAPTP